MEKKLTERQRAAIINRLAKSLPQHGGAAEEDEVTFREETLPRYSDHTLRVMDKAQQENPGIGASLFIGVLDHTEKEVLELAQTSDLFEGYEPETYIRVELLKGLRQYSRFAGVTDLTTLSTGDRNAARALMRLAHEVSYVRGGEAASVVRHDADGQYLLHWGLIDLAIERADRAEDIARFIEDRKITDPHLIRAYLDETGPLREGIL